jgi:hypothetical protein
MNKIDEMLEARIKEELTPIHDEEYYTAALDDIYPVVEIVGISFSPSRIVRELDPTAFRCGMQDYLDGDDTLEYIADDWYIADEVQKLREEIEEEIEAAETEEEEDAEED